MTEREERRQIIPGIFMVITLVVIATLIAGCSRGFVSEVGEEAPAALSPVSSSHSPTNGMVQSHDGGAVTIEVEWQGEEGNSLVFSVAMNTHSVDLDSYDLGKLAVLRDNGGREYHSLSWESSPGGHHRQGILYFPLPGSLIRGEAEYVEMVIRDVAGIETRIMKWEL